MMPQDTAALERANERLRRDIARMESTVTALARPPSPREAEEMAAARERADRVASLFGARASAPVTGESALEYRKRLLGPLLPHSPRLRDARLDAVGDAAVISHLEGIVYADAERAARAAARESGGLLAIRERDAAGRVVTKFDGDVLSWMRVFMAPGAVCKIKEA